MAEERRRDGSRGRRRAPAAPPVPLAPVDLLAGLAPDVELHADDLPPGLESGSVANGPIPATMTVAEAGRLVRSGDGTIRRLIRSAAIRPASPAADGEPPALEPDRAGVLPRTPDKPGE
jgi:hypothetical protein